METKILTRANFYAIVYLCALNFAVFWVITVWIGGDALSGSIVDGHYYLNSHGELAKVSRAVFTYSALHTMSLFVTHPLGAMIVLWLVITDYRKRRT